LPGAGLWPGVPASYRPVAASAAAPSSRGLGGVPVGSLAFWQRLSAFGFGMGMGWRRKPMTATSSDVVHFLGGVILSPYSLLSGGRSG
jgi:hypothetical protein